MRFKMDENLPVEVARLVQAAGHEVETVPAEGLAGQPDEVVFAACQQEDRVLVTLDRGFGDIRRYMPGSHAGIIVLCPVRQDRELVCRLMEQVLALLEGRSVGGALWIVEVHRVRVRSAGGDEVG